MDYFPSSFRHGTFIHPNIKQVKRMGNQYGKGGVNFENIILVPALFDFHILSLLCLKSLLGRTDFSKAMLWLSNVLNGCWAGLLARWMENKLGMKICALQHISTQNCRFGIVVEFWRLIRATKNLALLVHWRLMLKFNLRVKETFKAGWILGVFKLRKIFFNYF